jgi:hypothetical protein
MVTPGGRSSEYSTPSYDRALHALRYWLDSWSGIGHVAVGMHRQGSDPQLTQYDERGWRATFYTTGMEHSPTSATATAWERAVARGAARGSWRRASHRSARPSVSVSGMKSGASSLKLAPDSSRPAVGIYVARFIYSL